MNAFLATRYGAFVLIFVLDALLVSFGAWNVTLAGDLAQIVRTTDVFSVVVGIIGFLGVVFLFSLDVSNLGGVGLSVELGVFTLTSILTIIVATLTSVFVPQQACTPAASSADNRALCVSADGLAATAWICSIVYISYTISLVFHGVAKSRQTSSAWSRPVRDLSPAGMHENTSRPSLGEKLAGLPSLGQYGTRNSEYSLESEKDKEKDAGSMILPANYGMQQRVVGVDAINGAPAYHPYASYNAWTQRSMEEGKHHRAIPAELAASATSPQTIEVPPRHLQGHHSRVRAQRSDSSSEEDPHQGASQSSGYNWIDSAYAGAGHDNDESPAQARGGQQQNQSLYAAHIVRAEQTKQQPGSTGRNRSNTDPTRGGMWFPDNQGGDRAPSNVVLVDERRPSQPAHQLLAVRGFQPGHGPALSIDSGIRVTQDKKPKHRPPPLDLSTLSNIDNARKR